MVRTRTRRGRMLVGLSLGAVVLLTSSCGDRDTASTSAERSQPSASAEVTQAALEVPEGCPDVEDFTTAWFFDSTDEAGWYDPLSAALIDRYLEAPLPTGGCAYAETEAHDSNNSDSTYRRVRVAYFNLGEPGRQTVDELEQWALDASGTSVGTDYPDGTVSEPDGTHYDLLDTFSGWTNSSLDLALEGTQRYGEETMPEFTQGENAIIEFSLDQDQVDALAANSSTDETGAPDESEDPTTAMASGLAASYTGTFEIEDEDGYTAEISVKGTLDPFIAEVANSLPGEFEATSTGSVQGTADNTTPGRNAPVTSIGFIALYDAGSAACGMNGVSKSGDSWQDTSFCSIGIGYLSEAEIPADSESMLEGVDDSILVGKLTEDSDALAQLNAPIAIYARFGSDPISTAIPNVTSSSGCQSSGIADAMWYVPMEGWPDPICS